jgi:hypothetical protein
VKLGLLASVHEVQMQVIVGNKSIGMPLASAAQRLGVAFPGRSLGLTPDLSDSSLGGIFPTAPPAAAAESKSVLGGSPYAAKPAAPPAESIAEDPSAKDLIDLAIATLKRAVDRFGPVKIKINNRIKRSTWLNRGSAASTAVLSSSAFGALQLGGKETWGVILGLLTLLASLLTLAASWGGDAKFVDEFGEVSAKAEDAVSLRSRLELYGKNPERFPDWKEQIEKATTIANYILEKIARWSVGE